MRQVTDQILLVIYCFAVLLFVPADTAFVAAFLAAVICLSAGNMGLPEKYGMIPSVVFLGCACLWPALLYFTPAVLYPMLACARRFPGGGGYIPAGAALLLCLYRCGGEPPVLFIFALGAVFAWRLEAGTDRLGELEEEYRRMRDDSTELNLLLTAKNRELLKRQDYEIYTATLRERNRIAREIHDNVGHMLSRAILMTGAMRVADADARYGEPLRILEDTLNTAMTNVRESVHDLHDDSVNLREALSGIVSEYRFCPAELSFDMGYDVPREVKYSFIAVVKEALSNVARHSGATRVRVTAREHPGFYQLMIEDNGTGDGRGEGTDAAGERRGRGIGLRSMEERVRMLGGTLRISGEHGFSVLITVPRREEEA